MQSHEQPKNQLELLTKEVREIFDFIEVVPYDVVLKGIVLNNSREIELTPLLKEGARNSKIEIDEARVQASSILNKIQKFNGMMLGAYGDLLADPSIERVSISTDNLVFMMSEIISRAQVGDKKLEAMIAFCERLRGDMELMKLSQMSPSFVSFDLAVKALTQRLKEQKDDKLENEAVIREAVNKLEKLPATLDKHKEIARYETKEVNAIFKDVDIYDALARRDIEKIIKILGLLAKFPELVIIAQHSMLKKLAENPQTNAYDEPNFLIKEIDELNKAYLKNPLLIKGVNIFYGLDDFARQHQYKLQQDESYKLSDAKLSDINGSEEVGEDILLPPDNPANQKISEKLFEWVVYQKIDKSNKMPELDEMVKEIRRESHNFKNHMHRIQVVGMASELQEVLNKNTEMSVLKQSVENIENRYATLLQRKEAVTLKEKLYVFLNKVDEKINKQAFTKLLEKGNSGYALFKTKKRIFTHLDRLKKSAHDPQALSPKRRH